MARQFSPASTEKLYGVSPTKVRKVPQDSWRFLPIFYLVDAGRSFGQLLAAIRELRVVGFGAFRALNRDPRQRIAGCSQIACRTAALLPRTFSFH
jgi:hypothetical protein